MASREMKDTAIFHERRVEKSKDVKIQFTDPLTLKSFVVLDDDGNIKYYGKLSDNKEDDECSCPSWMYGMKFELASDENNSKGESRYKAENGIAYQCKHIIAAREVRYGEKN